MTSFVDYKQPEDALKGFQKVVVKRDSAKSAFDEQKIVVNKQEVVVADQAKRVNEQKVVVADQAKRVNEQKVVVADQAKRVKAQRARVDDRQKIVDENVKRVTSDNAKLKELKDELKHDESKLDKDESKLKVLKDELKELKDELKELKDELKELKDKLKELKDELKDDESKLKELKDELKHDESKLKELKDELDKLKDKLSSAEAAVSAVFQEHQTVLHVYSLTKDSTVADVTNALTTVATKTAKALQESNCFWFLQADSADDLIGYLHRCGTLDFDKCNVDRLDRLLREAESKYRCPLPDRSDLLGRVGERVADVKAMLSALTATKTIRDKLNEIPGEGENFLANVITAMRPHAICTEAHLAGGLSHRMHSYVVGAAELLLDKIRAPHTELELQMQCAALTARLSVLKTEFNANQIEDATSGAFASTSRAPSHGRTIDASAARRPDCFMPSAVEEWKQRDANSVNDERRLAMFAYAQIDKALNGSADAASVLMFTTMQVGFERTTHVTAVFACGGLVRFRLCAFDDIRVRERKSFIALVTSICQIYEYECMREKGELDGLLAAMRKAVDPAAPAAPSTPTKSTAAPAEPQPWTGSPRRASAPLPNSLPTPTKQQTLQRADPAAERALMTELRAGTTTQRNDDRIVVVGDKRVFKMLRVTCQNSNDVFNEVQLLSLANRAAPLHVVAAEHAFSATQYQWPCQFAAIGAIDIVALVMPRLAPLDWSALDLAEFARYGGQLCEALAALHAGLIVHFDVKPCNIAVDAAARQLKLLDFGLAERFVGDRTAAVRARGSKAFMAPEVKEAWLSGAARAFSPAVDVFSAGVTLRESPHAASCAPASELVAHMTAVHASERVTARCAAMQWHKMVERQGQTKVATTDEKSKKTKVKGMVWTGADKENQSPALVAQKARNLNDE